MNGQLPYWHHTTSTEGPEWLYEATRYIQQAITTVDTVRLRKYMDKARKLHSDNVPLIVAGTRFHVWGANVGLGNVPDNSTDADVRRGWGRPIFQEQIFIKQFGP